MVSVCLADFFQPTTAFDGKLHYTACYQLADFYAEYLIEIQKKIKTKGWGKLLNRVPENLIHKQNESSKSRQFDQ